MLHLWHEDASGRLLLRLRGLRLDERLQLTALRPGSYPESTVVDEEALRGELEARGDVVDFDDERWGHVPTLADGVVLTHVVSTEELDLGVLAADDDLDLWARLADEGMPLAGGGELRAVYIAERLPVMPRPGWPVRRAGSTAAGRAPLSVCAWPAGRWSCCPT